MAERPEQGLDPALEGSSASTSSTTSGPCLELCEEHGIGDFDLAYAYAALARGHALAGDGGERPAGWRSQRTKRGE